MGTEHQWLARCHVTIQHYSVAPIPKLSAEQKSSFPVIAWRRGDLSSQIGKQLACWHADVTFIGPKVSTAMGAKRYSLPMLAYFSSLREAASSAAAPASRADPVTYDSAGGIWPSRPNIKTCRCATGWVLDHRTSFRLCGATRWLFCHRGSGWGKWIWFRWHCRMLQDHRTILLWNVSRFFHNVHYTRESNFENRKVLSSRRNEMIDEAARTRRGREF